LTNDPVLVQDEKQRLITSGTIQEHSMEDIEDGNTSSQR